MKDSNKQLSRDLVNGDKVKSAFLITKKDTKKDKNGKYFCDLELQDRTGKISGKIWSDSINLVDINSFKKKDVVFIEGEVNDSDKFGRQINIKKISKIDDENIDYSDFIFISKKIDEESKKMLSLELKKYIENIENLYIKALLENIFNDEEFLKKFCSATAAIKNHHAAEGGLLLHTVSVTKICEFIFNSYSKNSNIINRDILFCGSILHDIGKTDSYSVGTTIDINEEEENLISHISLGYGMVLMKMEKIKNFPEDLKREILHIILSHHGLKEYGSPVEPQTLEAIIVYNADKFDADIDHFISLTNESPENECWPFSNYFKRRISIKKNPVRQTNNKAEELQKNKINTSANSIGNLNMEKLQNLKKSMLESKEVLKDITYRNHENDAENIINKDDIGIVEDIKNKEDKKDKEDVKDEENVKDKENGKNSGLSLEIDKNNKELKQKKLEDTGYEQPQLI